MFFIFHGDDPHAQRETMADLQRKLGDPELLSLNTIRLAGSGLAFGELRQACDAMPFLADKRLVIVTDLLGAPLPWQAELLAYLPELPETTRLILLESRPLADNHPVLALAEQSKNGYVRAFRRPEGSALERWVRQRVEATGGRIAPRAAALLATSVGGEMLALENEIEKLVLYKGEGTIEPADVELLCPYAAEASIFELVDALGGRNGRVAASLLHAKLHEGVDPFYLFAMVIRQFRLLIQVKELAEEGATSAEMARKLKVHPFVAGKVEQQSRQYTLAQLEQIYRHLLEIDVGVKTGRTEMVTALGLLVAGLAA